jgi:hypothetical protein
MLFFFSQGEFPRIDIAYINGGESDDDDEGGYDDGEGRMTRRMRIAMRARKIFFEVSFFLKDAILQRMRKYTSSKSFL